MAFGNFAAGFASTFSPTAVGGAINQGVADYKKGQAIDAANKAYDEGVQQLDLKAGRVPEGTKFEKQPTMEVGGKAIPVQGSSPISTEGVDPNATVDTQKTLDSRMSDQDYMRQREALATTKAKALAQADVDYYSFRGMDKERAAAEKKLADQEFMSGMRDQYWKFMDGDEATTNRLLQFANMNMGEGQLVPVGNGQFAMKGPDGTMGQAFTPTTAQKNQLFTNYVNMSKFFRDGDFGNMLDNQGKIETMALNRNKDARETRDVDSKIQYRTDATTLEAAKLDQKNFEFMNTPKVVGGGSGSGSGSGTAGGQSGRIKYDAPEVDPSNINGTIQFGKDANGRRVSYISSELGPSVEIPIGMSVPDFKAAVAGMKEKFPGAQITTAVNGNTNEVELVATKDGVTYNMAGEPISAMRAGQGSAPQLVYPSKTWNGAGVVQEIMDRGRKRSIPNQPPTGGKRVEVGSSAVGGQRKTPSATKKNSSSSQKKPAAKPAPTKTTAPAKTEAPKEKRWQVPDTVPPAPEGPKTAPSTKNKDAKGELRDNWTVGRTEKGQTIKDNWESALPMKSSYARFQNKIHSAAPNMYTGGKEPDNFVARGVKAASGAKAAEAKSRKDARESSAPYKPGEGRGTGNIFKDWLENTGKPLLKSLRGESKTAEKKGAIDDAANGASKDAKPAAEKPVANKQSYKSPSAEEKTYFDKAMKAFAKKAGINRSVKKIDQVSAEKLTTEDYDRAMRYLSKASKSKTSPDPRVMEASIAILSTEGGQQYYVEKLRKYRAAEEAKKRGKK